MNARIMDMLVLWYVTLVLQSRVELVPGYGMNLSKMQVNLSKMQLDEVEGESKTLLQDLSET